MRETTGTASIASCAEMEPGAGFTIPGTVVILTGYPTQTIITQSIQEESISKACLNQANPCLMDQVPEEPAQSISEWREAGSHQDLHL